MSIDVYIDWNDDGDFGDTNENVTSEVISASWSLGNRLPFQGVCDAGVAQIILKNTSGKYMPENGASPLAGSILPGRAVKIESGGTLLWQGFIQMPRVDWEPGLNNVPYVHIDAYTNWELIAQKQGVAAERRSDLIIGVILEQVGLDTTASLDVGAFALPNGLTAKNLSISTPAVSLTQLLAHVVAAEGGQAHFFIDREGTALFYNRTHWDGVTTIAGTIGDSGTYRPTAVSYNYGEWLANSIRVVGNPQTSPSSSEQLWELAENIKIPPGGTVTFDAYLRRPYGMDASASAVTNARTFSGGTATVTTTVEGSRANVEMVNSGGGTVTLSAMTLTGTPAYKNNPLSYVAEDAASIAAYGLHELQIQSTFLTTYEQMVTIGDLELARRKDARGGVNWIRYDNSSTDGDDNAHQVAWTIGTKLRVNMDSLYHDENYFIVGEEHVFQSNTHTTTFYLEIEDQ